MIKKNLKVLLTYCIGILVSLFLSIPLGFLSEYSLNIFSTITAIITLSFLYSEIWKFGKYDSLKKETHFINPICYMVGFVIVVAVIEVLVLIFGSTDKASIIRLIGAIWFYPFTEFLNSETFVVLAPLITIIIILLSIVAYHMGIKGFSLSDKILDARKKRIDKKAEKHFEEIEKIKEQYRAKKAEDKKTAVD